MRNLLANLMVLCVFASAVQGAALTPAELIDPMIGAQSQGHGSTMPGPCLPHSSVYPSPDSDHVTPGGYVFQGGIVGFSQLHTQGTGGTPSYGNLLVSPQIGLETAEKDHVSPKADESSRAFDYGVMLTRYKIRCEVVPAAHSVLYKFTFPASTDAHIALDVARKIGKSNALTDGIVAINPTDATMTGGGIYDGNWAPGQYKLYFTAQVSKKPESFGAWTGNTKIPQAATTAIKGTEGGGYMGFSTHEGEVVFLKIGVSFKSPEQSAKFLHEEIPDWNFEKVRGKAMKEWNDALKTVSVSGADDAETSRVYTALFHTLVQPRDRTGEFWNTDEPFWDDQYTLWDSWRTVYPLLGLMDAKTYSGVVNSFIARHQHDGFVPETVVGGVEYSAGQGGNEADNIITDAYWNQIPGIDWQGAHAVQLYNAEKGRSADYLTKGYTSIEEPKPLGTWRTKSGAATLEFAYNDYCVAQLAKALGNEEEFEKYQVRSGNWQSVWNDAVTDNEFSGFANARHQDGTFSNTAARAGYNADFYEGTCWTYSFRATHALDGMVAKMGGRDKFIKRLNYALKNKLIDFTNEPSFQTPWLFAAVKRPYLSSYWADQVRSLYQGRSLPGDEDNGAMSSLYCFLDMGFFPFAGQDIYYLHGGRLPKVSFRLHNGKTFTIINQNVGAGNIYVRSATLNGKPLENAFIRHADIFQGGTLKFVMGAQPSAWGCGGDFKAEEAALEVGG